jgi:uncharacterized protein YdeI (BOF family)
MKKLSVVMLFFLLVVTMSSAQSSKVFYGDRGPVLDSSKAQFYIVTDRISDTVWVAKQYAMDNTIMMEGTYKDQSLDIPNGNFVYYEKIASLGSKIKGTAPGVVNYVKTRGEFRNGAKDGRWTEYFFDGRTQVINTYKNDLLDGLYENYYQDDTTVSVRGNYINDKREGYWYVFSKRGNVIRKELYKDGKVTDRVIVPPAYIGAVPPKDFNKYIRSNISKLTNSNTNGTITVEATITKAGKVLNPTLTNFGISSEIADKVLKIVSDYPTLWTPPIDTNLKQAIDDNISFFIEIRSGEVTVNYSPTANALVYQLTH